MRSSEPVAPERLEKLLGGAAPEGEREALVLGLVRELRSSAPAAPPALRDRVGAIGAPDPTSRRLFTRRRVALVLALVALAVLGAALVHGGGTPFDSGSDESQSVPLRRTERAVPPSVLRNLSGGSPGKASGTAAQPLDSIAGRRRAQDVDMFIEVRVRDADRLSDAANDAMRVTRELGGFVVSSSVGTHGREGQAELRLNVPVGQVREAAFRLSQLGTITGQRIATVDLQSDIDRLSRRIVALRSAIRIAELELQSGTLDPEERLQVEILLERRRALLGELRATNTRLRREAATAEITLRLHTRAAPAGAEDESGLAGAARDGLAFLAQAGSVALFLAIVLSPLLLLVTLAWLALRSRSRRIEERLLERTRPGAPTPQSPRT